jgi:hypothetical protein
MRFFNDTPAAAGLLRSERPDSVMAAALVARRRLAVRAGALVELPPAEGQSGPRVEEVRLGDYGVLEVDELPPRTGTDVIVLGDAVSRTPTIATRVAVLVGPYDVQLDVFGDRVWEGLAAALIPSSPVPFKRMPLTWARAFGGSAQGEYGPIPHYKNPEGRGYYLSPAEAKGQPLPNVERAGVVPIKAWDDRPDPAGLGPYPSGWGLRTEKTIKVDREAEKVDVDFEGGYFDRAHPDLSGKRVTGGKLVVRGMTDAGVLEIDLPDCPYAAHVELGGQSFQRPLELEEILLDLRAEPVLELGYRKMFRYPFIPHQRRVTRLVPAPRDEARASA